MAWIFQCLLWVSLVLSPSLGYGELYDYQEDYNIMPQQREVPNQRTDHNIEDRRNYERQYNERINTEKPAVHERQTPPTKQTPERPTASERSIPFNTQRAQNSNRKRPNDDGVRRNGNSTFKIVNNFPKPIPIIATRRGVAGQQATTTKSSIRDNVVFPGPTSRTSSYAPLVTDEECLKTGICENVPNYPEDRVNEIVKQLEAASYKFNVDKLDTPEITQRIGPHEEMLDLCKSKEMVVTPRAVRDNNNKWHVVLNQEKRALQGFRVEICQSESSPCSDLIYVVSSSYNKTCVQKHQYRKMVVLDDAGNSVEREFRIPSCCSCAIFVVNQFGGP